MWFFTLLIGWAIGSQSLSNLTLPVVVNPYGVTALLNDSTWFGSGTASKVVFIALDSSCTVDRVDINFATDLPYNKRSKNVITGCVGDCDPTQHLFFRNVPLAIGKYSLSTLGSCIGVSEGRFAAEYWWISGGDIIVRRYRSLTNSRGWVQVTKYDKSQNMIEGTFEMELFDYENSSARFRKGVFRAKIVR